MPIETTQDLHDHLELAISIELATVPPYLYGTTRSTISTPRCRLDD